MKLSISDYAAHRGVSRVSVHNAINAGRIEKESDGTIDADKADAAWQRNTHPTQKRKTEKDVARRTARPIDPPIINSGPSYAQSRAIKEAYHARLAKLSYEEKTGSLVKIDLIKVAWFNTLRVLRDRVLNMPDRMAPLLSAEGDPKVIRDLLDKELRQVLGDAADAVTYSNTPTE
jgi:hypothetical protein